jgi:hypothetical protein
VGYFKGKNEPFTRASLCYEASKGWNCFVPIPYQKSCKVVADKGWGNYFHFTYTTFPKDTQVPTFKRSLATEEASALDAADKILSNVGSDPAGARPNETVQKVMATTKLGTAVTVAEIAGPQAITGLRAKLDVPPSPDDRILLRDFALQITWDGEPEPSVWAPFGDFFGTAAGANKYKSLPSGLTDDGWWYCYWYMPFAKSAKIELLNDGAAERNIQFEITHAPVTKPIDTLARFHVKWHRDALLPSEPERAIDWTMLKTDGHGRFCGVMLHVWNPHGGWWGEGDEKFFVDGEKFPSTIGTGSEDYFGYAWSNPELFTRPYHNQTISMNNAGHICVNRWHINDNVPFQKSFEGCIEKYYPNIRPTLYACTAYWYLAPGGKDPYKAVPAAERTEWPQPVIVHVQGAIEGEKMKVRAKTGGDTQEQIMDGYGDAWSGGAQLWWTGAKPGDKLDLVLPVKQDGKYHVAAQLTKARDYGIVQLYLDGEKLDGPIDLYHPDVVPTAVLDLGKRTLAQGSHQLTVEILGANPQAEPAYMAGIDYIKLEPSR